MAVDTGNNNVTHYDLNGNTTNQALNKTSIYAWSYKNSKSSKKSNTNYVPNDMEQWKMSGLQYFSSKSSKGARLNSYLRNDTMHNSTSTLTSDEGKASRIKDSNGTNTDISYMTATANLNGTNFTIVSVTSIFSNANFTNETAANTNSGAKSQVTESISSSARPSAIQTFVAVAILGILNL